MIQNSKLEEIDRARVGFDDIRRTTGWTVADDECKTRGKVWAAGECSCVDKWMLFLRCRVWAGGMRQTED